jgi:hypothetical protein
MNVKAKDFDPVPSVEHPELVADRSSRSLKSSAEKTLSPAPIVA